MPGLASRWVFASIAAVVVSASAQAFVPAPVELAPKFVAGKEDKFTVELVSTREAKFVQSSTTRPERYEQTLHIRRRVLEADSDGAKIELTYENIAIRLVAGNKWVTYDTRLTNLPEQEEMVGKNIRPAHNKPFVVEVDALGRPQNVIGAPPAGNGSAAMSLTGDEFIQRTLAPLYGLGKQPSEAEIGQTWSDSRDAPPGQTGVVTTTRNFKLESVADGRAEITITGSISLEPSEKAKQASTVLDSNSVTGRIVWNLATGTLASYSYDQSMKLLAETDGRQRVATTTFKSVITAVTEYPPPPPQPEFPAPSAPAASPSAEPSAPVETKPGKP